MLATTVLTGECGVTRSDKLRWQSPLNLKSERRHLGATKPFKAAWRTPDITGARFYFKQSVMAGFYSGQAIVVWTAWWSVYRMG